jgi:hypothetical protein
MRSCELVEPFTARQRARPPACRVFVYGAKGYSRLKKNIPSWGPLNRNAIPELARQHRGVSPHGAHHRLVNSIPHAVAAPKAASTTSVRPNPAPAPRIVAPWGSMTVNMSRSDLWVHMWRGCRSRGDRHSTRRTTDRTRRAAAAEAPYHLCKSPAATATLCPVERTILHVPICPQPRRRARSRVIGRQLAPATVCVKDAANAFEGAYIGASDKGSTSLAREKNSLLFIP